MNLLYIKRSLETVLIKAVLRFPAVLTSGPRRSAKTTLLQQLLGDSYRYVFFKSPDIRDGDPHRVQASQPSVVTPCG